jgi:hypothetical protein
MNIEIKDSSFGVGSSHFSIIKCIWNIQAWELLYCSEEYLNADLKYRIVIFLCFLKTKQFLVCIVHNNN